MAKIHKVTRRELIKEFGLIGFLASPILRSVASAAAPPAPARYISIYKPFGFMPLTFWPKPGYNFTGQVIEPLNPFKNDIRFIQNMNMKWVDPDGDTHGKGMGSLFTGTQVPAPKSGLTNDYDFPMGISIDQRIANNIQLTKTYPFPSLHFGVGILATSSQPMCRISHRGNKISNASEENAGIMYDKIMGKINMVCGTHGSPTSPESLKRLAEIRRGRSSLDFSLTSLNDFKKKYGLVGAEAEKLDATATKLREVETALAAEKTLIETGSPTSRPCPTGTKPTAVYDSMNIEDSAFKTMIDLMLLAFDWDLTRVLTLQLGVCPSRSIYTSLGYTRILHSLSHLDQPGDEARLFNADRYIMTKIAMLLQGLKTMPDPGGSNALYNSTVFMGSEVSQGNDHNRHNMPFIVAGNAGGRLAGAGSVVNPAMGQTNHHDLLLTLARVHGISAATLPTYGDVEYNNGVIPELIA